MLGLADSPNKVFERPVEGDQDALLEDVPTGGAGVGAIMTLLPEQIEKLFPETTELGVGLTVSVTEAEELGEPQIEALTV